MPLTASASPGGTTIYVDDDAALGGDGLSWDTAYRFLQDPLAGVPLGVLEIRVAQGTYTPDQDEAGNVTPGDREATFQLQNGVALMGGYAGIGAGDPDERDIALHETILSGDLNGDDDGAGDNSENSYHVVTGSGTDRTAILEGFSITAGNANNAPDFDSGAGVLNVSGSPTFLQCAISGNVATSSETLVSTNGAGMFNRTGSSPMLIDCVFVGNCVFVDGPQTAPWWGDGQFCV